MERSPPILFDRARLRKRRARAATSFAQHDFLHREAAAAMAESFSYITHAFPTIVELGGQSTALEEALALRPGTAHYFRSDLAPASRPQLCADEERLPFAENSVDAVVSILSLQWVNDLPGTLAQVRRMLRPDGLFMAIIPGGETLRELRTALTMAESAHSGGVSPRVAPFIDVRDAGALLQRAGFALPVADSDILTVTYADLPTLMTELRGSGHSNMLHQQAQHFTARRLFADAAKHYAAQDSDAEGRLTATVEFVTLTGWKPAASQQQPARRGSGEVSLTRIFQ